MVEILFSFKIGNRFFYDYWDVLPEWPVYFNPKRFKTDAPIYPRKQFEFTVYPSFVYPGIQIDLY